jgi:hypothetical protein
MIDFLDVNIVKELTNTKQYNLVPSVFPLGEGRKDPGHVIC